MPSYEVQFTAVVEAESMDEAEDEARRLIQNPRFEPMVVTPLDGWHKP